MRQPDEPPPPGYKPPEKTSAAPVAVPLPMSGPGTAPTSPLSPDSVRVGHAQAQAQPQSQVYPQERTTSPLSEIDGQVAAYHGSELAVLTGYSSPPLPTHAQEAMTDEESQRLRLTAQALPLSHPDDYELG